VVIQILVNLLDNAITFTPQGEVTLRAGMLSGAEALARGLPAQNNGTVWFSFTVRDTGLGISPDKLREVFRTFVIAEDFMHKELGGTGLGLSIAQHLAKLHQGRISVQSTLGQGSLFCLELPLELAQK